MKMFDLGAIQVKIYQIGKCLNVPREKLLIETLKMNDGGYHLEIIGKEYHYIKTERGSEYDRKITREIDDVLCWFFTDLTFSIALAYEVSNRVPNRDSRRIWLAKQIELLELMSANWASKRGKEMEDTLKRSPFDDNSDIRIALIRELKEKGYSYNRALNIAMREYPYPKDI